MLPSRFLDISPLSSESRDLIRLVLVMMYLVYMRIATSKLAVTKHMMMHRMIDLSSEDELTKLDIKPGGGFMLGIFARAFASAMLACCEEVPQRQ